MMKSVLALVALLATAALGQEMMDHCFTCKDLHTTCKMDCIRPRVADSGDDDDDVTTASQDLSWPYTKPVTGVTLSTCISSCDETLDSCTDSDETTSCQECLLSCATTYHSSMGECVQSQSTTTKMTHGKNLDACAITASDAMDECKTSCSTWGSTFFGWTPTKETGEEDRNSGSTLDLKALKSLYQSTTR